MPAAFYLPFLPKRKTKATAAKEMGLEPLAEIIFLQKDIDTNFGAFVDLGIKEYRLIHISELSDKYIKSPHDVVKINQKVNVKVINIGKERKRISLSLKEVN